MSGRSRDGRTFTDDDAARMFGVSGRTVRKWRARGWLVATPDGRLDRAATIANVSRLRDPTLGGRADRMVGGAGRIGSIGDVDGATTGDSARLLKARTAREALAARRLQIELDVRAGKLVDAARFEAACVERITEAKSRVESIPDRVAARLVGLDRDAITEILRGEFEAALKCLDRVPVVDDDDVVA